MELGCEDGGGGGDSFLVHHVIRKGSVKAMSVEGEIGLIGLRLLVWSAKVSRVTL